MYSWLQERVLRFLHVPPVPDAPAGAPGSVRVFRAGANFYKLRLIGWCITQLTALVGIVASFTALAVVKSDIDAARLSEQRVSQSPPVGKTMAPVVPRESAPEPKAVVVETSVTSPTVNSRVDQAKNALRKAGRDRVKLERRVPVWVLPILGLAEGVGVLLYLLQIPVTYAALRLDFEQRWYIVTDRSLRIRSGIWRVQELTMSFANLQKVVVSQGPLQRLLGLADVQVQSAGGGGGGGGAAHGHAVHDSLHTGIFHSVENAAEIRDLILARLRDFRATGLGDPDDHRDALAVRTTDAPVLEAGALAAAQELLGEARALRAALTGG